MYTSHVTQVLWNGIFSSPFLVENGVKQGGIVSPILFCVYLDGLLKMLKESKVGCFVGHLCVAAVAYADDIVLLAPTARAMRLLQCVTISPVNTMWYSMRPSLNVWCLKRLLVDSYI